MRIVTRADFDSIVCAVLLYEALDIKEPVKWVEPDEMQKGEADIRKGDIIANLPYNENCSMWFDHHFSNQITTHFEGAFRIAPSAARVIYDYYRDQLKKDFSELTAQADKIDDAQLTLDEVEHPENYPYVLLSMTIASHIKSDVPYWNKLITLLREQDISSVMADPDVQKKCARVIVENKKFKNILLENTEIKEHVAITDFRGFDQTPDGNRFMAYSLFPETVVSVKISCDKEKENVKVRVGHSIFNRNCNINVGKMLTEFEGGGHRGAGAATFHVSKAEQYVPEIIEMLVKNESNE